MGCRRSWATLFTATLLLVLGCGRSDPPAPTAGPAHDDRSSTVLTTLQPAAPQQGSLPYGRVHSYTVEVPSGNLAAIEVDSLDSDLVVTLRDTYGTEIARLATPASNVAETLLAIPEIATALKLEIRADGEGTATVAIDWRSLRSSRPPPPTGCAWPPNAGTPKVWRSRP